MKTEEEFEEAIIELIDESLENLREIERIIFTKLYGLSDKHFSILALQSVAMLYAVWERYIQKIFCYYIEYINSLKNSYASYDVHILKYNNEVVFKQFKEYPTNLKRQLSFHEQLTNYYLGNDYIELKSIIDTESNVGFDVLNKLLRQFSLEEFPERCDKYDYPLPTLKESLGKLLYLRNTIAHGGDLMSNDKITKDDYAFYRELVMNLMYAIVEKLHNGISGKTYLRPECR